MTANTLIKDFTTNQIIYVLAKTKRVEKILKKFQLTAKEDIAQNIYLSLLKKDINTLRHLFISDEIDFYIARMVTNNVKSKTNSRLRGLELNELNENHNYLKEDQEQNWAPSLELITSAITSIKDWYTREIAIRHYLKKQTLTYISETTKIPQPSLTQTNKRAKEQIKKFLDKHNPNIN